MTLEEKEIRIQAVKDDQNLPLPLKAKAIERIIAEFRTSEYGDGRAAEERARYEAYDSTPANV